MNEEVEGCEVGEGEAVLVVEVGVVWSVSVIRVAVGVVV